MCSFATPDPMSIRAYCSVLAIAAGCLIHDAASMAQSSITIDPAAGKVVDVALAPNDGSIPTRAQRFERLHDAAKTAGSVRVIVELKVPNIAELTSASTTAKDVGSAREADRKLADAIKQTWQVEQNKVAAADLTINRTYDSIPFVALSVTQQGLRDLEASPNILSINEDRLEEPTLNNTASIVGAPAVWASDCEGSDWYVAVLDTGIRASHEFFAGKDVVQARFAAGSDGTPDCPNGLASQIGGNAAQHHATSPSNDHGSHVSGIAVGNGPGNPPSGIARGSNLIAVQVFSQFFDDPGCGGCDRVLTFTSDQLAGLNHVYSLRTTYNIAAVNMSLGGGL